MNISALKQKINHNQKLKSFIHNTIISKKKTAPRLWVKVFVNPFFSKRKRGSVVRFSVKLNVTPINAFYLGVNSIIES
ncbi:MAG: acyltransferase, partial [Rikenellaceae bacterium]